MPILIPPTPPPVAEVRPLLQSDETAIAQGLEGQQVRDQLELVSKHWFQHTQSIVAEPDADLLDELNDYRHVPFERVGSRRVRYVRIEPLKPRKTHFAEDEE